MGVPSVGVTLISPGAFFDDISGFDPGFFNIAGIEARYMDPQQRAFLMTGYKALEDAGYAGDSLSLKGVKQTGVFAGCYPGDYFQLFGSEAPAQSMWGAAGSVVPARLSYFLDLDGPAVSVDYGMLQFFGCHSPGLSEPA